ncbi:serine/threonine protein kinase [Enhygromyxa salina]|uniref:Serine/threonine protein kinase n=1 Tax=Enhygromyxa salina TaxID=215803 RepID=A0A0C2CRP0_9BACT|nr:serine/threonine protein kinase [Enhygromyxa salina]
MFGPRRFRILQKLTSGEPAELYLAEDRHLCRPLTLKLLHANTNYDPIAAKLLEREARLLARIDHPNVAAVLDLGVLGTELCMTLQAVGVDGLSEWLANNQPGQAQVLAVLRQAGQGLAAAHAVGVVHGDLIPARVRIDRFQNVRLVDFERARDLAPEPGAWERQGPPLLVDLNYAAPETRDREKGRHDRLSDQYSFCVLAWEALTGRRPPHDVEQHVGLRGHRREPAYKVLARGLSHNPTARWPDMDQLLEALERAGSKRFLF